MNKKITLLIVALTFLVVSTTNIFALGITPGRTTIDFEPGLERTVEFTIINSNSENINIIILVEGELNESISLSKNMFSMKSHEKEKKLSYNLKLSEDLEPGLRTAEIIVIKVPEQTMTGEAFIGASVGVAKQVRVRVPYPGKYAEARFNIIDTEEEVYFTLPVINRGRLDLGRVSAVIDIYTSLNEKIETIHTNQIGILSSEKGEVVAEWKHDVLPGKYRAVATLIYDEKTMTLEEEFNIGEKILEVQNIEVNDFSLGGIAKFEILVENKWGEEIKGAFAEMEVYGFDGKTLAEFKSHSHNIPPFEKTLMVAFWDTIGVREGDYQSELFLNYEGRTSKYDLQLDVSDRNIRVIGIGYVISPSEDKKTNYTSILIIVLVIMNLFWFLYFRKKLISKNKPYKEK